MGESEGTAEIDSSAGEVAAAAAARAAADEGADGDLSDAPDDEDVADDSPESEDLEGEDEAKVPEPPRRRLVAELLEGEEYLDELPDPDAQLIAPPLHVESGDSGQPIYQLDLSSDEPQGVIVAPELFETGELVAVGLPQEDPYQAAGPTHSGAYQAVKQLIVDRERRVMAAERDGIGAYDLAVELDDFVYALVDALRRAGG